MAGSIERGVRVVMKVGLEQSTFIRAGADGTVSPERLEEARKALVDSMMSTCQEMGRAGSSRQKELLNAVTKGHVMWSEQSAANIDLVLTGWGRTPLPRVPWLITM